MDPIVFSVIITVILLGIIWQWLWRRKFKKRHYVGIQPLLTNAERNFYPYVLKATEAYPHITVCCKVRIADIVRINPLLEGKDYATALGDVAGKHVDYLLVDNRSWRPLVVLELDDSSHDLPERQARDEFVDTVFTDVRLPIIHVKARAKYTLKDIKTALLPIMQASLQRQQLD